MIGLKTLICFGMVSGLILTGCKKSTPQPQLTPGFDVYMAGTSENHAVYWKNGQKIILADNAVAKCIAVSGSDVCVGGQVNTEALGLAAYWKNGQQTSLTGSNYSIINGIAISQGNVYSVGRTNNGITYAVYWKNDSMVNISQRKQSEAFGIMFSGSDMYIAGHAYKDYDTAVLWKNGLRMDYTIGRAIGYAVSISGTDVYVVGTDDNRPVYWKNGVRTQLNESQGATSIAISGSDVYIAGATVNPQFILTAAYWKNGVMTTLSGGTVSYANGIAMAGSDIYVVGFADINNISAPVYWKNGVMTQLGNTGQVSAIAIVSQ